MQLSGVMSGGIAEWGFYNAPDAPRGSGRAMGRLTLAKAFGEERLHKVFGQVLVDNAGSIRLHQALGFRPEGVLRAHYLDNAGSHHDIHCFGLLRHDWLSSASNPAL
jgi:RimJ/RimL family protein N-acetyltransferase